MPSTNNGFVDYYRLLSLTPSATTAEIRRRFMHLAKECHPDKGGDVARMQQLNNAYATLSQDTKRRAYDLKHQIETGMSELHYRYNMSEESGVIDDMSEDEIDSFINDIFQEYSEVAPRRHLAHFKQSAGRFLGKKRTRTSKD